MRNLIMVATLLFLVLLTASVPAEARDFRIIVDPEVSRSEKGDKSLPAEDRSITGKQARDKQLDLSREEAVESESSGQLEKIPNPYIMGRGYDNQGLNMSVFGDQKKIKGY